MRFFSAFTLKFRCHVDCRLCLCVCDECGEREMEMAAIRKGIWEEKA